MPWKPRSGRSRNISVRLAESDLSSLNIFASLNDVSRVALAVSGGSDSVAMLRLVHAWAERQEPHPQIFVLTVDHGLRPSSADEAAQVQLWCSALHIHHETLSWKNLKPQTGLQAKARQARYDLMSAWCAKHQVPVLLTAHTADDQAETVLMRKERTSSAASLAGIWPEREWNGIRIIRLLLQLRRTDLRNFLVALQQTWIEDPSNDDDRFERVRVRKRLQGEVLGFVEQAKAAQDEVRQQREQAQGWSRQNLKIHDMGYVTFDRVAFSQLQQPIQDNIVSRILLLCGMHNDVELRERSQLITWLCSDGGSRRALGGALFAKRRREIIVGREPGRISKVPLSITGAGEVIWDRRFRVSGPVGASVTCGAIQPRQAKIPAFIQAGFPVVMREGLIVDIGVKYEFLRH